MLNLPKTSISLKDLRNRQIFSMSDDPLTLLLPLFSSTICTDFLRELEFSLALINIRPAIIALMLAREAEFLQLTSRSDTTSGAGINFQATAGLQAIKLADFMPNSGLQPGSFDHLNDGARS